MANKSVKKNTDEIDVEALKKQMELMQMALNMISSKSSNEERDIPFISLNIGVLNLSTEGNGRGEVYTFKSFGEEKVIPESHAKQIVRKNSRFIKSGLVYIDDKEFIDKARLKTDYTKILSKDEILGLFNKSKSEFEKIFTKISKEQKETIASLIADKLLNSQEVDMNIVKIINNELNINIDEEVANVKKLKNNEE